MHLLLILDFVDVDFYIVTYFLGERVLCCRGILEMSAYYSNLLVSSYIKCNSISVKSSYVQYPSTPNMFYACFFCCQLQVSFINTPGMLSLLQCSWSTCACHTPYTCCFWDCPCYKYECHQVLYFHKIILNITQCL